MKNHDKLTVLVADDSALILEFLEEMLNKFMQVEIVGSVNNGTDALKLLQTQKPDLAIVDLMMPGLNGFEVLSKIRRAHTDLIFILLASKSAGYYRHLALTSGADYFCTKPNDFELIPIIVADCITNKFRKSKNYRWTAERA